MRSRRLVAAVLALGVAAAVFVPSAASAVYYFGSLFQQVPSAEWTVAGDGPLDGIGQWVYVAPTPPPGPAQLPTTGYVYGPSLWVPDGASGVIGLSNSDEGPIAGIQMGTTVTIPYDWSPGKHYFLLAYRLGDGLWGGWVVDATTSTWTFIGSVPAGNTGLLRPATSNGILGAQGRPIAPFSNQSRGLVVGTCRSFPEVDVFYSPPVGYRGTAASPATLTGTARSFGDCPTELTVEQGWAHFGLGLPPVGAGPVTLAPAALPIPPNPTTHLQSVPVVDWLAPGTEPLDGIGQWVYVAPIPPPAAGQLPTTGYVYGPTFLPAVGGVNQTVDVGVVGLSQDEEGPLAVIKVAGSGDPFAAPVTIRYDWSPGKFYYLVAYHLGDGAWGGWVYDLAADAWTFIGSMQASAGSGLLRVDSGTVVYGARGAPAPAFARDSTTGVAHCSDFPRVDAYFYPPLVYRGATASLATLDLSRPNTGDCGTETSVEADGWVHFRLGTAAA